MKGGNLIGGMIIPVSICVSLFLIKAESLGKVPNQYHMILFQTALYWDLSRQHWRGTVCFLDRLKVFNCVSYSDSNMYRIQRLKISQTVVILLMDRAHFFLFHIKCVLLIYVLIKSIFKSLVVPVI